MKVGCKVVTVVTAITALLTLTVMYLELSVVYGQNEEPLPVILIHGYRQDASSWYIWEDLLQRDEIPYYLANFDDGMCGSSEDHARELGQIVEQVKLETGSEKVNIVGFSKGGLDARVYLEDRNNNVENLIMIGTPNGGAPLAYWDFICYPAADDLEFGSEATRAVRNPNTNYYTIYGDWVYPVWNGLFWITQYGNPFIPARDDGLVPVWSVNSKSYFTNIGNTFDPHNGLQTVNEYNIARSILLGN